MHKTNRMPEALRFKCERFCEFLLQEYLGLRWFQLYIACIAIHFQNMSRYSNEKQYFDHNNLFQIPRVCSFGPPNSSPLQLMSKLISTLESTNRSLSTTLPFSTQRRKMILTACVDVRNFYFCEKSACDRHRRTLSRFK